MATIYIRTGLAHLKLVLREFSPSSHLRNLRKIIFHNICDIIYQKSYLISYDCTLHLIDRNTFSSHVILFKSDYVIGSLTIVDSTLHATKFGHQNAAQNFVSTHLLTNENIGFIFNLV